MKCRKCGQPAVINMRRHKLALCASCYLAWFPAQAEKAISRFDMFSRDDPVLVAVSGGKDSLGLWDVLLRLGYQADGIYVNLGIGHDEYSQQSLGYIHRFVEAHAQEGLDLNLHVVDVQDLYGATVPKVVAQRKGRKACSVCGLIKRHEMNRVAYEHGYAALATGHNLDDEAATLLMNTLHWQTGYLGRQNPVLPSIHPRLAKKVKPLCLLYERESAAYTLARGIEYVYDECPYAVRAKSIFYKHLLNELESKSPGAKLQFYLSFLQAKEGGQVQFQELASPDLDVCCHCGQPTLAQGLCAFCRLWADEHVPVEDQSAL